MNFLINLSFKLCFPCLLFAAKGLPPAPPTFVYDEARLSSESKEALNKELTLFQKETGHQMVVAFFQTLENEDLDDYANRLFRSWKIGDQKANDGILLLIAIADRKLKIEVGYGLEGDLPDIKAKKLAEETLIPSFRKGDYVAGVLNFISSVKITLGGGGLQGVALDSYKRLRRNPIDGLQIIIAIALLLFLLLSKDIVLPMLGALFLLNTFMTLILVPVLLVFYAVMLSRSVPVGRAGRYRSSPFWWYSGNTYDQSYRSSRSDRWSGWGGGFGGGGSGGGFSGGGGSSGGGGYSGNW